MMNEFYIVMWETYHERDTLSPTVSTTLQAAKDFIASDAGKVERLQNTLIEYATIYRVSAEGIAPVASGWRFDHSENVVEVGE